MNFAITIWYEVFRCLDVVILMPLNLFILFDCVNDAAKAKKSRGLD